MYRPGGGRRQKAQGKARAEAERSGASTKEANSKAEREAA